MIKKPNLLQTFFSSALLLFFTHHCLAFDPPQLVKNANTLPAKPIVRASAKIGNTLYIAGNFETNVGLELYKLDTITGQMQLVKDIKPGSDGSAIDSMVAIGSTVYFNALNTEADSGLWKSDGTEAGTQLVKSFTLVPNQLEVPISNIVKASNKLYFTSRDENSHIWYSDGTTVGTTAIDATLYPSTLMAQGSYIFFSADNGVIGREPYYINASSAPTTANLIKDINPGVAPSYADEFYFNGTKIFFSADDGTHGKEPFISNGTPGGTSLLKDIGPATSGSDPINFSFDGVTMFFLASTGANYDVWKSDGTSGGTVNVTSLGVGFGYKGGEPLAALPNKYLFPFNINSTGRELYVSNGTAGATGILKEIGVSANSGLGDIFNFVSPGGVPKLLFTGITSAGGEELWITDGTSAGTQQLLELASGGLSANPNFLLKDGSNLFFIAFNGISWGVYITDGSASGTNLITALPTITDDDGGWGNLKVVNGKLYGNINNGINGLEPLVSDGTAAGSFQLFDVNSGFFGSFPNNFNELGSKVFFNATDPTVIGNEPWGTDGSSINTNAIGDFNPGLSGSFFEVLANINGITIFKGSVNVGSELYRSDGTAIGTILISDLNPGTASGLPSVEAVALNGQMYFGGTAGAGLGTELYKTDGFTISLIKDIRAGATSSSPKEFATLGNKILFSADDGTNGRELWISDGTDAGTQLLFDVNSSGSGNPVDIVVNGSLAFFLASNPTFGKELWRTDGTAVGTSLVKDLTAGASNSTIFAITPFKNGALFKYKSSNIGDAELWFTDGTEAGTVKLQSIIVNNAFFSTSSDTIAVRENLAFFKHYTASKTPQIFVTDGTVTGTQQVTNIPLGPKGYSLINGVLFLGGDLLFGADFESVGFELYKIAVDKCVDDTSKLELGVCGCGVSDADQNGNGQADCLDPATNFQPSAPKVKVGAGGSFTLTGNTVSGATAYEFKVSYKLGKKKKNKTYRSTSPKIKKKLKGVPRGTVVSCQMRVIVGNSTTAYSKAKKFKVK